ncbi:hypothetical protein AB0A95_33350 [Micromonospora sp. NPDC049230]|uniref:hypothetical protein n=1 Tax=Micromonospora sp. NPDC049230 TaxID=3155502 RepID=UPI0033CABA09
MAAESATNPPTGPPRARGQKLQVEQPPRTILRGGERVDISHLTGEELYQALISDEELWGYKRLSAETGRTVVRIRKWVHNIGKAERTGRAPDDKTFIAPDEYVEDYSPRWKAGRARKALMGAMGVMTREGVMIPHKPTGRAPGAQDNGPRRRWENAPLRDTAVSIYREYLKLTQRKSNPLNDRDARSELSKRHDISRTQLARRIATGRDMVAAQTGKGAAAPAEVDGVALRDRLAELVAEQRAAGYSERGASDRARTALAAETGLTRRQLAGYIAAAEAATETAGKSG